MPPRPDDRPAPPRPARTRGRGGARDRGYRVANAVSYVLNPLVFPPVAFALLDAHFGAGPGEVAWTFGVSLVFFCLVPLLYVVGMVRRGRAESLEVRERAARLGPLLVGVASYAVGALLLAATVEGPALPVIVAFAALYPLNTAALLLINLRWKISIHMTSLAGFVGVLLFAALTVWRDLPGGVEAALTVATVGPLVLLLPLLMWARVRVGAHSVGQVVAGAAFGLVVPQLQLWWIVYEWLGLAG
ncbi:hypothetical protein RQM47_02305 [Rubrivirga sp. S365]|uniref:PAP2 superfamily protein n=1 Tax=Rubrivirga litoralis TaxID=3075598 RepID=A0ABU3BQI6_9BACT|nr:MULTISPECIES: hypothetical protein [unclassified Rubrivirga]MDT0631548.1 hypothetical protein [Rubrivirga sp. F394]MDT7855469.1 hypothetical protein [Rubrivirga sp. S365]